jgi:hypothetical protein
VASGPMPGPVRPARDGGIEIEFAAGARMRITGAVDAATLKAAVAALADGRPRGSPFRPPYGCGLRPTTPICAAA